MVDDRNKKEIAIQYPVSLTQATPIPNPLVTNLLLDLLSNLANLFLSPDDNSVHIPLDLTSSRDGMQDGIV